MPAFRLLAHTLTSAVGSGCHAHAQALAERRSGLRANDFTLQPLTTWIGRVAGLEDSPLPARWAAWDCRNNRLAWQALQHDGLLDALLQLRGRWPAHRLGIAVGTSTGSIAESETGYRELQADGRFPERLRQPALHSPHSLGDFLQAALDWQGPCLTLSTACSSSAKAYATAARWLQQGVCDAVLVGGCDSLCQSTLHGFASLQLTSPDFAALEAAACELPVIATRIGGIPEVVNDGESGYLSEVGDVEKMSADTLKLVNNDDQRIAFGKRGRNLSVQRYSTQAIIPQYISFYEQVLNKTTAAAAS